MGKTYDALGLLTAEKWYADLDDTTADRSFEYTYDEAGRLAAVAEGIDTDGDGLESAEIASAYQYAYDSFGRLDSTTQDLAALDHQVRFDYAYDASGRTASVAATVDDVADFQNGYAYDRLGRVAQITQSGVSGGNAVAEKRVDLVYDELGQRQSLTRYADLDGTKYVAGTDYLFDELGRLTSLRHSRAGTTFADYDLAWDKLGQLTAFDFSSLVGNDGTADYTYDDTGQLTVADYNAFQTDESYAYDANGNRANAGYATGDHNRLRPRKES